MSTRNDRLFESFLPLDSFMESFDDPTKIASFSDHGSGAEAIYDALDEPSDIAIEDEKPAISQGNQNYIKLLVFEGMLILNKQEKLIPIFEQIVINGKNRQKSITALAIKFRISKASAERKYYRGVKDLLTLISPNKNRSETHFEKVVCQ